eukprot:Pgem_evm1s4352
MRHGVDILLHLINTFKGGCDSIYLVQAICVVFMYLRMPTGIYWRILLISALAGLYGTIFANITEPGFWFVEYTIDFGQS